MQESDAPDLLVLYSDAEAMQHLTDSPASSVQEALDWMRPKMQQQERDGFSLWSMVERATSRVIGDCGLQYEHPERPDIGIGCRLARRYWGRGYALEASAACLEAGFQQLGFDRIIGVTRAGNTAARRAMERLNMVYEGPGDFWFDDEVLYDALRDTWRPPIIGNESSG